MVKFFRIIWESGPATIMLYAGLLICLCALLVNIFFPIPKSFIESTVGLFTLLLLADILYLKLKEIPNSPIFNELETGGIIRVMPIMEGDLYKDLMSKPGRKNILNGWIYNFSDLSPLLNKAIQNSSTTIHLSLLNPNSKHAIIRGEELSNRNVVQAIKNNIDEIACFYSNLTEEQKQRVKVYLYDNSLKFSIYACGDKALVGMFWPQLHAVNGTQFLIEGRNGHFSRCVWNYFDLLDKKDITETLLSRLGSKKTSYRDRNAHR